SIEEDKQKKEYERIMKEAEERKNKKRKELIALRHEFVSLLQKNQELPKHMQLHREHYMLNHRIFEDLNRQMAQRIQLVQKQLAWEHEKHLIGLQKLQNQFLRSVEFDTVVVRAIQSNHQISTYRLLAMSEKCYEDQQEQKQLQEREIVTDTGHARIFEEEEVVTEKLKTSEVKKPMIHYIKRKHEQIKRSVEKSEKVKAKIMKRKAEWDELYKSKPSDDYENPRDVEDIKAAQENIGYYKLKTDANYRVPTHKQMNTEKKMMQLTSLETLIHRRKVDMNKEIMSLRDRKVSIIDEIKCIVQELKSIQTTLDLSECLRLPPIPQLHPDEIPEKKFEYDNDILLKFKEEQEAKAKLQEQSEGSPSSCELKPEFLQTPSTTAIDPVTEAAGAHLMKTAASLVTEQKKVLEIEKAEPTEVELEILKREKIKNLYLQETLIKRVNALVTNFDAELRFLRHQKLLLDVQLKNADLCHNTGCEELLILKNLEKQENLLQGRVNALISEQEAMQSQLDSNLAQMDNRKHEILKLQEREKALYANFHASLGENNEFAHFLTKVLKKKIKCIDKKDVEREADDEEENEEEYDEESSLGSDEENSESEDELFDDSVCPETCDEALFQNTIQLRLKRLDIEKALTEEKKAAANLRKKYNALAKKAKVVETSLETANKELETFQWEKQQRLNDLYVVVPLKLHQVEYSVKGKMPSEFSQALVFTNQSLQYLRKRIVDLHNEKIMQRQLCKKAQKQHKQLVQDKKEMELQIRELEEKCNDLMMKKFGQLVDFEAVQTHSVNIHLEELKVQIMEKEYVHSQDLKKWQARISDLQQQLMELTKENTSKLQQLNQFHLEKQQLESKLSSPKNDLLGVEFQGTRSTDMNVKARLKSQLKQMAHNTGPVTEEIYLLHRKDGSLRKELALLTRKEGFLFQQPSSPQDSESSLPVLVS
ncbi:CFA44 protein, partial [Alcedo cyanopectus]|nr:CFA44 protein [Ceyx cyanopectus]